MKNSFELIALCASDLLESNQIDFRADFSFYTDDQKRELYDDLKELLTLTHEPFKCDDENLIVRIKHQIDVWIQLEFTFNGMEKWYLMSLEFAKQNPLFIAPGKSESVNLMANEKVNVRLRSEGSSSYHDVASFSIDESAEVHWTNIANEDIEQCVSINTRVVGDHR